MHDEQFLHKLDALRPRLLSRARGGAGGSRASRMLGTSAEFSDFREYAPGDDIRRIDWNAYARFDKLFLKLFMEEQEAHITILLDGTASMGEKWPCACQIAEAYAYAALSGGDRVRIAIAGEGGVSAAPFGAGRRDYLRLSSFAAAYTPKGQADLSQLVRALTPYPKGLTLTISDFLWEDAGQKLFSALRFRGQEVCAVQVLAPQELRPAYSGALRLLDSEGAPAHSLTVDERLLRQYQDRLNRFLLSVRENCHKNGAPYVLMDTGEKAEDVLIRQFLQSGILE